MDAILQQILDLLEQAPLTQTGKNDIRHTIRTEYYEAPEPLTLPIITRRVRLAENHIDPDCECPPEHRHSTNNGLIQCFECVCAYSPTEPITRRVNLMVD